MKIVPGPDFPTRGFIYGTAGIKEAYEKGRGRIVLRARAKIETQPRTGKTAIIITEIPYSVNKAKLIERIADLVRNKKIEGISDLRDESDREGMRIVVELKKEALPPIVLNRLYSLTPMENTFGVIMLAIVAGRPRVLTLKEALLYFIYHRREVVTRRTKFDLEKALERAHILEGLVKAIQNIDEIISIIKASKTQPEAKERLIARFSFSDIQAQAILDMRLGRLTSLEMEKIIKEYEEVLALIEMLRKILSDEKELIKVIVEELIAIKEEFADERRTEIVSETKELTLEDLVAQEDMVVTVSHNGYIKRTPLSQYRSQQRGGKGISAMDMAEGDFIESLFTAQTHDHVLVFSDTGKAYGLRVHEIPQAARVSKGRSVANLVQMQPDEKVASMLVVPDVGNQAHIIMLTERGMIKKSPASEFANARHSGIVAVGLAEDDRLVIAKTVDAGSQIVLVTENGNAVRFSEEEVRPMGRAAQGVKAVRLSSKDRVVGMALVTEGCSILTATANGFGKRTKEDEYPAFKRGGKGVIALRATEKTGKLIGIRSILPDDEIIMISDKGKFLRLKASSVSIIGRNTQGVRLMNLDPGERLVGIAVLAEKEEENGDA